MKRQACILLCVIVYVLGISLQTQAQHMQRIQIVVPRLPNDLDPHGPSFWSSNSPLPSIYETLIARDNRGRLLPGLAESWSVSRGGEAWQFRLRDQVRFHNGEQLTASAAVFSLQRFLDKAKRQRWGTPWQVIQDVKIVNDDLLRVHLSHPTSSLLDLLATGGAIVSPSHFKSGERFAVKHPVGTGPFKLNGIESETSFAAVAFRDYWGGVPPIDEVNFLAVPDHATRMAILLSGRANIATDLLPEDVQALKGRGIQVAESPGLRSMFITCNTFSGGPLADVRVRLAMAHAIDVDSLVQQLWQGFATKIVTPAPATVFKPHVDTRFNYDPGKAKRLLAEAGYPNGFNVELNVLLGWFSRASTVAEFIAAELAQVGIDIDIRIHGDWSSFRKLYQEGNRPLMALFSLRGHGFDPYLYFNLPLSSESQFSSYKNSDVDRLIQHATETADPKVLDTVYNEITSIIHKDAPIIPLFQIHNLYGVAVDIPWSPHTDGRIQLFNTSR